MLNVECWAEPVVNHQSNHFHLCFGEDIQMKMKTEWQTDRLTLFSYLLLKKSNNLWATEKRRTFLDASRSTLANHEWMNDEQTVPLASVQNKPNNPKPKSSSFKIKNTVWCSSYCTLDFSRRFQPQWTPTPSSAVFQTYRSTKIIKFSTYYSYERQRFRGGVLTPFCEIF